MSKIFSISTMALTLAATGAAYAQNPGGGFAGPGIAPVPVAEALKMKDDAPVVLTGRIEKSLGNEKYQFSDDTGTIVVEIDDDDWNGVTVRPENTVELRGEIDKELIGEPEVDVNVVAIKK